MEYDDDEVGLGVMEDDDSDDDDEDEEGVAREKEGGKTKRRKRIIAPSESDDDKEGAECEANPPRDFDLGSIFDDEEEVERGRAVDEEGEEWRRQRDDEGVRQGGNGRVSARVEGEDGEDDDFVINIVVGYASDVDDEALPAAKGGDFPIRTLPPRSSLSSHDKDLKEDMVAQVNNRLDPEAEKSLSSNKERLPSPSSSSDGSTAVRDTMANMVHLIERYEAVVAKSSSSVVQNLQ